MALMLSLAGGFELRLGFFFFFTAVNFVIMTVIFFDMAGNFLKYGGLFFLLCRGILN